MKPKPLIIATCSLFLLTLCVFVALCLRRAPAPHQGDSRAIPVQALQVHVLSNAPSVVTGTGWAPGWGGDPQVGGAMRVVAERLQAACSNRTITTDLPKVGSNFRDAGQTEAFQRLQKETGASLKVFLRPQNSTPIQIKGNPLAKAVASGGSLDSQEEATARSFLRDYAALLLLDAPDQELQLAHRQRDDLGRTTLRFTQFYQGLQVWPAELAVHLNSNGDVDLVDGAYEATPANIRLQPALTAEEAEIRARDALADGHAGTATTPTLVIYAPLDAPARLAWKLDVSVALDRYWSVAIDALEGSALRVVNLCTSGNVSGSGMDLLGIVRPLNVWQSGSTYYMWDASKPMFDSVKGTGVISVWDARNAPRHQVLVGNTVQNVFDVTTTVSTSWANPDAVSGSYNLGQIYDYYSNRHGRNSFDGNGSDIAAVLRIGNESNAFWHGGFNVMFFGNADRYVGSLDVVGHEVTHGVIFSIGNQGVLDYQNQSGALNEAFADIFGDMIEARAHGTNDWLMGSQLNSPMRNMADPSSFLIGGTTRPYPSKFSELMQPNDPFLDGFQDRDHGGVHLNNTIISRAYFLLAGGLRGAIGNNDAERIFYRCLTVHMKPRSQFIDARLGCIAAAEAHFGANSTQALLTAEAFDAVEIYATPASAEQPASVNAAVAAADSTMFMREHWFWTRDDLGRRETARGDSSSGSILVTSVKLSRPSVSGNGLDMLFVGGDDSLCYLPTSGSGLQSFYAGLVHSVAISPEGRYGAFVFNAAAGVPTNQIVVLDLWSNQTSVVDLKMPVADGAPLNNISYADALDFSADGGTVIYDALSTLRRPDGQLRQAWSVFALDMATLRQSVIIPPQDDFQVGNPAFSQTSGRYLVFDAQYTNGNTAIVTADLFQGTLGLVGVSMNGVGYPCFNGDDSFVVYADEDSWASSGRSLWRQNLSSDKMSPSGSASSWLSDAKLAVLYRRGNYPSVNTPPTIFFTGPAPNAVFTAPASVSVTATAGDMDGSISRVEFYNGSEMLFTDSISPYGFSWNGLSAGIYRLSARAYDNQGASTTTPTLTFSVKPAAQPGVFNRPAAPGFEFSVRVPQPGLYRLEASTNLLDWLSLGSFFCQTNLYHLDSMATNFPTRFYRAVPTP